jgi:hypothetical protein
MNPNIPHPMEGSFNATWGQRLVDTLHLAFNRVLSTETASPFALLIAQDGGVWKVTVSNAGAITTVKMAKGKPL